jgi:cytoskeletal protein CcmA (bactofilin family)
MPSTYTLNNGIELIGTGEQSGTWGDTTNTNLGLLDAALDGQVTVALASAGSSGSPNSLPITDGTASNGRNRMVVFSDSGDLGATAYVQLTPNDAEKIIYIRNSLSGSRSVILFQGTYNASNDYEVPAGTTAIVYFDGAGAGAVAANVFNNAYFDGLRLGSVSVTAILDEDNMASDSATALATQQSIKAYVDSQVGTVDTLAEILAIGNTTGATDIAVDSAQKVQFRDAAIYINSSVDGQLDIVADTEIQIAATTVDLNGNLDVSGTLGVTGVLTATSLDISGDIDVDGTTNLDVVDIDGAVDMASTLLVTGVLTTTAATVSNGGGQFNGAINVGVDDTGYDVKFFGATTGKSLLWDESADSLIVTGTTTLVGTTNLDAVDIDGATQIDATVTVGVDDTGYDVKFFGATAGAYMLWDESADDLILGGAAGLSVNSTALVTGVLTTTAATVSNGGGQFNGAINVGVDDTGYDVKFFGATAGKYMLWDESADTLEVSGTVVAAAGTALLPSITTTGDLNTGMWFPAADTIAFSEGGVEALRINSSGRVGIGTSSPVYNFVVSAAGASGIEFGPAYSGTANLVQHYSRSGAVYVDAVNVAAQHRFDISGTERMRIDSLGGLITKPAAGGHAVFNDRWRRR